MYEGGINENKIFTQPTFRAREREYGGMFAGAGAAKKETANLGRLSVKVCTLVLQEPARAGVTVAAGALASSMHATEKACITKDNSACSFLACISARLCVL